MKVDLYEDRCVGAGQCTLVAPRVFDQREEDGIVILLADHPPFAEVLDEIREAQFVCPAQAIQVLT